MKGNLSQIYPIPFLSKKETVLVKIYLRICFSNLNKICTIANLMQSRLLPHLHRVAKLVQIYFLSYILDRDWQLPQLLCYTSYTKGPLTSLISIFAEITKIEMFNGLPFHL